ncbi:hypothetical protein [Chitinophaga ginsengisoli]|uniref:Uncharacterized protein n=1 Tax=Chitinophaga ginsengisoli TaxID=363837 RepID=A0A2P8GHV0_9BACT|nr:hypothetical protein [Chitinophaga ginsengisoli]PSL33554.1 hypothetical protein CLV42_103537 [Chitinophaga ginsengisoli]
MLNLPNAKAGLYTDLLQKITSYQDRLSVRYVLEKLLITDSQSAAVDHETMKEYLSAYTIHLLLSHDFILRHDTPSGTYYELSNDELIEEVEGYAGIAPNKEIFDNEPLVQITLKTWRKRQDRLERDQRMHRLFLQIRKQREAQMNAFLYEVVVPLVCILLLAGLIFGVTHLLE